MALTEEQKKAVRADFMAWSRGDLPDEVGPERIDLYVDVAAPRDFDKDAVHEFFNEWMDEMEAEGRP